MKIRFLTYNLAMLPSPLGTAKEKRAEEFVKKIMKKPVYDIIGLQEIFAEEIRDYLTRYLKEHYPYIVGKSGSPNPLNQDSGLFFASKFPIMRHTFQEFHDKSFFTPDKIADKGILAVRFEFGSAADAADATILRVFLTHLQSRNSEFKTREKQLTQLRRFITQSSTPGKNRKNPAKIYTILLGDFNVTGDNGEEYRKMLDLLDYPRDLFREKNPKRKGFSWNSQENLFLKSVYEDDNDMQRLDYVFSYDHIPYVYKHKQHESVKLGKVVCHSCGIFKPKSSGNSGELPGKWDLSDHYGVEAVIEIPG
jgi:endonuclease/exonuclease/phosphatase family metal-dependent hydrolase